MRTLKLLEGCIVFAAALSASAASVAVPEFPAPAWAGREVTIHAPLADAAYAPGSDYRLLRVTLDFHATPSNNVQVALGTDAAPADGALSPAETALVFGWDCGAWVLRPGGLRECRAYAPADAQNARRRVLTAEFRLRADGTAASAAFEEEGAGAVLFGAPPLPLSAGAPWSLLRATARGAGTGAASVSVVRQADGTRIILQ